MNPLKVHISSVAKCKDTEMVEILDKEVKSLVLKMINDLKEKSS
jgi:hypothetical protein